MARSRNRELDLENLLDDVQPDIVALSETELPVTDTTFTVKNYTVLFPDSCSNKFRLLLLIKKSLVSLSNPVIIHKSALDLWVKLHLPAGPLIAAALYRQWGEKEAEELAVVHAHAASVASTYKRALIMGDANLDVMRRHDRQYYRHKLLEEHLQSLESVGFRFAGPESPTFYSHGRFDDGNGGASQRTSTLDHIYLLGLSTDDAGITVLPYAATDHRPITLSLNTAPPQAGVKHVHRRNYKNVTSANLNMALNAQNLSRVFLSDDVDEAHEVIVREIEVALDKIAPFKEISLKDRPTPLNLKVDTLKSMSERDRAAATGDITLYRKLRNRTSRLVRRDRLDSNQHTIEAARFNPKKVWAIANGVMGKGGMSTLPPELVDGSGTVISGDVDLANHVNRFYIDKISDLRSRFGSGSSSSSSTNASASATATGGHPLFELRPPTETAVRREIRGLRNTGAEGVDHIPVAVLKMGADLLAAPIAHLISLSIRTARVPTGFKKAIVIPVHKKKKPANNAGSYRPVSLLPAMSKVMEGIIHKQLITHMEGIFPNSQHGFRPGRNTVGAIIAAHGEWMKSRSKGEMVGIAAYDLSSAFDTIDHGKLVEKLETFGIKGRSNKWFADYLSGRSQRVDYNGSLSEYLDVRWGVPQGSILGPTLFLCLLVDLPAIIAAARAAETGGDSSSSSIGSSGYADDVVAWSSAKDINTVKRNLEEISSAISSFMASNFLVLNNDKTQILWVGGDGGNVRVGDISVSPSNVVDVLGVQFDHHLSPAPHANKAHASARMLAGASRRLSLHLRSPILKDVVRALVVGKVGYGCAVFKPRLAHTDPTSTALSAVQTAINDCARFVLGYGRGARKTVEELLSEASLPSLNRMVVENIALETWKAMNYTCANGSKIPIGQILCTNTSIEGSRPTRSISARCIPPPTKFKSETFAWHAYKLWNSSPLLRSANTLANAQKAAKTLAASAPL